MSKQKAKRRTSLQVARDRADRAALNLSAARAERRLGIMQKYDVLEPNKSRRQPGKEFKDEGGIYDQTRRLHGCALGRDLERNYSPAKGMLHQFRVNVVGSLGKLQINLPGAEEATAWFNEVWAKDPDYRTDLHLSDWFANTVVGVIREGDQLTIFDDGLIEDSGKLVTWEADQIAPLSKSEFDSATYAGRAPGDTQDNGIIRNKYGREIAYIVTGKRGKTIIDKATDATIYPRGLARLIRNPWRHNQGRGVPSIITPAANFLDLYEILASELQTAKRAAKQYANVKRTDAVTDWDSPNDAPEFLPENSGKTAAATDAEGANLATATGSKNYERLEAFAGGFVDYLDAGDEVEIPDLNHPNSDLAGFMDAVHGFSGSALGMAAAYTKLRADKSYTAFRGDMIMTWVTFLMLQKWLERRAADWAAINAVTWGMRTKQGFNPPPEGWDRKLAWNWPTMPQVDPWKEQNAIAMSLKNATTDFAALLGPDWEARLRAFGGQVDLIREILLPLGILETKSGGTAEQDDKGNQGEDNE